MEFHVKPRSEAGKSFRFVTDLDRVLIGRGEVCDVRIPYPPVSFHHATVQRTPSGYELTDNGSTNGTWHRGRRVHPGEAVRLASGDRVAVPGFLLEIGILPGVVADGPSDPDEVGRRIYRALLRPDMAEEVPRFEVYAGPLAGRMLSLPARAEPYVIGRDPACDWEIPDREASREHLVVSSNGEKVRVIDRGSKNGVRVNGRVVREVALGDGDTVEVGRTVLTFHDARGAALRLLSTETSDQTGLSEAFAPLERGGESRVTDPDSVAADAGAPAAGTSRTDRQEPPARADVAAAIGAPPREAEAPSASAGSAEDASPRDLADFLAAPPLAATVARREGRTGGVPDGADALIVALGVVVFLVCLVTIYVLLR